MKQYLFTILTCLLLGQAFAQMPIKDESIRYQQERMVFKQWDKNKFKPGPGFFYTNPFYWLTWGLMPSYKKNDLRPLSATGFQTQRLAFAGAMNETDEKYKLQSDTLRNTALSEIANEAGVVSVTDPLWQLYYNRELKPVTESSEASILNSLPAKVRQKVREEGLYDWYKKELDILKERIEAARSTNLDRGARILAYHRMLQEYRILEATWATRTATAVMNIEMAEQQEKVKTNQVIPTAWTPKTDVEIAKEVLKNRKY